MLPLLLSILTRIKKVYRFIRRHLKATIAIIVVLIIGWTVYAVTRPTQPVYVTDTARRGDLRQTVEAVGTVVSEKDLQLQFSSIDVVSQVFVREGDRVKAGDRLATLRSGSLSASVASASANVQSAQAALRALEEGSRPEDIAIAEAGVANKRASLSVAQQTAASADANLTTAISQLDTLKNEANISLSGQVSAVGSTMSQQLATAKTAILVIQGVFNANDISDAVIKAQPSGYETVVLNMNAASADISAAQTAAVPATYQDALQKLSRTRSLVLRAAEASNRSYDIVSTLPLTSYFTNTSRETAKSSIATQKTAVQSALATLDATTKSLQDASATYDTRIATQESQIVSLTGTRDRAKADISTYTTLLAIDEAQLALKKAPARQTDIDAARARVRQAQAELARASAQYNDTILRAPVDGTITLVNVKAGEVRPTSAPSVSILGDTPYRIEIFVSEVDIPKVKLAQSGSITLDAFRDAHIPLVVGFIDTAATDKDGVPKYRVKLDFLSPPEGLKVGMTGDAIITTGERKDVVSVPVRSVIEKDGKLIVRIQKDSVIEERTVTTGMEGEGGNVEVVGVEEGETVIVLEKK